MDKQLLTVLSNRGDGSIPPPVKPATPTNIALVEL